MANHNINPSEPLYLTSSKNFLKIISGLPFVAGGLGIWSVPHLKNIKWNGGTTPPPTLFIFFFGLIFFLIGASVSFGRHGAIIDKQKRLIIRWWGWFIPIFKLSYQLQQNFNLNLSKVRIHTKNGGYDLYSCKIIQDKPITLINSKDLFYSRKQAELTAKYLCIDLKDLTAGDEIIRSYKYLDESIKDRFHRNKESLNQIEKPAIIKSLIGNNDEKDLSIQIPPTPDLFLSAIFILQTICMCIFLSLFINGAPILMSLLLISVFISCQLYCGWNYIIPSLSIKSLSLKHNRLIFSLKYIYIYKQFILPFNKIEECIFNPRKNSNSSFPNSLINNEIIIRNDEQEIRIGNGLSDEELSYIHYLMMKTLTA
jgi:hypothetical protein